MSNRDEITLNKTYNIKKFKVSSISYINIKTKWDQDNTNKTSKKICLTGEGMDRREENE